MIQKYTSNMEEGKKELFVCQCDDVNHSLIMETDDEWGSVFCRVHLVRDGFFKRIWNAIRYVFGRRSIYGDFDEFIFNPEDADRLQEVVDKLKKYRDEGKDEEYRKKLEDKMEAAFKK